MSDKTKKVWEKPWTTEEIISKSDNWSLAGDVALLHSFKKFAQNMFMKTNEISKNVDHLLNSADEVQLKLNICQNEFHSLKNTQFIESRVYEDDETLDSTEKLNVEERFPSEEEKEKMMLDSIAEGLKVMEEYYEAVEVDVSDSEEETEKSFILKPKDLYVHRKLPPVIGTDEWFKKWHIDEESSDSESDKVSEVYSESDSEECLPKHLLKGSETSSELDTSSHKSGSFPTANSGFSTNMKPAENASSDENSEGRGSLAVKAPISNQSFAEQLSAKLGNVISQKEHIGDIVGDINKRPIQTATNTNYIGGLYPDEPPPLDYTEDQRSSKEQPSLFDENDDDDLFWGQRPKQTSNQKRVFVDNDQPNRIDRSSENAARTSQIARGLFDSDSSTDESDLFAGSAKALSKPPFLQTHKTSAPLFDDLPPDLEDKEKEPEAVVDNKKPVGGVSIFGNTNIFANQSISDVLEAKRSQRMKGNESNEEPNKNKIETESRSKQLLNHKKQSKTPSLFDDDDDEVDFTAPKKTVGLFESGTEKTGVTSKKLDFFDESVDENSSGVASRKVSLFDDSVSDEDTSAVKKPTVNSEGITQKKTSFFEEQEPVKPKGSLPADSSPEKEDASKKLTAKTSKKISLFDDDDDFFKDDIFSNLGIQKGSKKGLFDDLGDTDSDLFSLSKNMDKKTDSKSKKTSLFSDNEDEEDIFESKTIKPDLVKESKKISSLFSDTEEEAQSDGVKSEPPPSKVEEERAEKKQVVESLSERKVIGAEVCDDESKNKKNEKKSGGDDVRIPKKGIKSRTTKIEGTVEQEKRSSTSMKSEKGDGDAKKEDSSGSPAKRGSPLKLKPNLNINVNALLPGSTPPKLKTPRVGESGDKDKVDSLSERKPVKIVDSQTENKRKDPISCSIPPPLPISVEEHVEKPISFDDSLDRVKVLHSVTKDRARIPVRRKPSTRQARQEAARKSAIFLEDADLDEKSTQKDASPLKTDVYKGKSEVKKDSKENTSLFDDEVKAKTESKKTASTSLFDDSDENDIFRDSIQNTDSIPKDSIKSPSKSKSEDDVISSTDDKVDSTIDEKIDVSSQSAEKTPVKSSKPEKTDKSPFDESTESEDDFFKRTVKKPTKTKSSLFDSGDESDNDLFGSKSSKDETKTEIKKVAKKKSLFDDSESDDDLFSSAKSKNAPSGTGTKSSKRATKKSSSLKKLDKDEASEDPLSNI